MEEYIPTNSDDEPIESRKVDFGVHLRPSAKLEDAILAYKRKHRSDSLTINTTVYPDLDDMPLALYIETKTRDGNLAKGQMQLGIWAAVHFIKLREIIVNRDAEEADLGPHGKKLQTIPLVLAQGTNWMGYFASATQKSDGVTITGPFSLGSVSDLKGAYKVVMGLRKFYHWAVETYGKWFDGILTAKQLPVPGDS